MKVAEYYTCIQCPDVTMSISAQQANASRKEIAGIHLATARDDFLVYII